jgi:hypothetical protein
VTEPTYRTIALFFRCATSSSRSFRVMTQFVQWLRASFNMFCENETRSMRTKVKDKKKAEFLPHQYAPGSPALQVDDGAASVPFLSKLRGQKLLALKVSQQRDCSDVLAISFLAFSLFHSLNRFSLPRSVALSTQILHARLTTKNLSAILAWRKRFKCTRNCTRHL